MPAKYTIRDLERLSGIKAHTLRVWEQRYGILVPERTATNIRWYCADELKKLLNISMLNNHGLKISRIAQMSPEEIARQVAELIDKEGVDSEHVTTMIIAMIELDEARFEKIFAGCVLRQGFESTVIHIILPLLRKVSIMWQTGSINRAQEHFISNLIRQKIVVAIDGCLSRPSPDAQRFLLFLPNGEMQELHLLFYHYMIKNRGHHVIYLGQSVPFDDIAASNEIQKADILLTVITGEPKEIGTKGYLERLHKTFMNHHILLSGHRIINKHPEIPENMQVFHGPEQLQAIIEQLDKPGN
ncbi:MAG: regulatory protein MerR [Bacteroidetes bacterium]|nr:MAG: regulatory protein MerR [Bacteroidota bacterium]